MAVDVVDGLEMVEIEQEQRNLAPFRRRLGDKRLSSVQQRAAVENAGQRIGLGQPTRALLGLGSPAHLAGQYVVAPPAHEQQGKYQDQRQKRTHSVSGRRLSVREDPGGPRYNYK